jgi:hypothetical protein
MKCHESYKEPPPTKAPGGAQSPHSVPAKQKSSRKALASNNKATKEKFQGSGGMQNVSAIGDAKKAQHSATKIQEQKQQSQCSNDQTHVAHATTTRQRLFHFPSFNTPPHHEVLLAIPNRATTGLTISTLSIQYSPREPLVDQLMDFS